MTSFLTWFIDIFKQKHIFLMLFDEILNTQSLVVALTERVYFEATYDGI